MPVQRYYSIIIDTQNFVNFCITASVYGKIQILLLSAFKKRLSEISLSVEVVCIATWTQFSIQYRSKETSTTMGHLLDPKLSINPQLNTIQAATTENTVS
jgi:hypothetical protein